MDPRTEGVERQRLVQQDQLLVIVFDVGELAPTGYQDTKPGDDLKVAQRAKKCTKSLNASSLLGLSVCTAFCSVGVCSASCPCGDASREIFRIHSRNANTPLTVIVAQDTTRKELMT